MASGPLRSGKARHTASGGRDGAGSGFRLNFYSRVFRSVFLYSSCGGECAVYCDKVAHRTSSRLRL